MKQYVAIKKGEAEPCVDSGQCAVKWEDPAKYSPVRTTITWGGRRCSSATPTVGQEEEVAEQTEGGAGVSGNQEVITPEVPFGY